MEALNNILERGFHVHRNFAPADLVAAFAEDHARGVASANQAYHLGLPDPDNLAQLRPLIQALIDELGADNRFGPTRIGGGVFFAVRDGINFGWHQDHESYFIHQTHRNYLNVYIPILKPDRERSNLSVVPADNFSKAAPDLWQALEGRGASTFRQEGGRLWISDDCSGGSVGELDFHLDTIAETPELGPGDALLLRGDLFHRTQDNATNRVALSVRVSDDSHLVTRAHFEQTCDVKAHFLARNAPTYEAIAAVFAQHEALPLHELFAQAFALRG